MWNLAKNETSKVTDVSQEVFPTGMQWPPKLNPGAGASTRKGTELLLVTAADGHFHLLGRGGRVEKSVQGHKGYKEKKEKVIS
jgi:intraflagellar transport protein 80